MAVRRGTMKKTPSQDASGKNGSVASKVPARPSTKAGAAMKAAKDNGMKQVAAKAAGPKKASTKATGTKTASAKAAGPRKASEKAEGTSRAFPRREDLGAPVEVFFARQQPEQRVLLEALDGMVRKAAPDARASIKWGMPYYEIKDGFCALYTASTSYVGLNIMAPPEKLDDPEGKLEGSGKTMRHLKVRSAADLDEASIVRWLKVAVALHS